jgi:hypothetical protein
MVYKDEVIYFYNDGCTVKQLAEGYNKSEASIRMLLVKAGVYVKPNPELKLFIELHKLYGDSLF